MSTFNLSNLMESIQDDIEKDDKTITKDPDMYDGDIDPVYDKNDLEKIYDGICPISGIVSDKLNEADMDPKNINMIFDESEGIYYIDYRDFGAYCEATWNCPEEAIRDIVKAYSESVCIDPSDIRIVVPTMETFCNCNGSKLGYVNIAWSSNFLMDCVNAGIKCTTFVNPGIGPSETITEAAYNLSN